MVTSLQPYCNARPVNGIHIAQAAIFGQADCPTHDGRQTDQANLLQIWHLISHQSIVVKEILAPNHGQVGKEMAQCLQTVDAVQQEMTCDLPQQGEAKLVIVFLFSMINQQDVQLAFNDSAVF